MKFHTDLSGIALQDALQESNDLLQEENRWLREENLRLKNRNRVLMSIKSQLRQKVVSLIQRGDEMFATICDHHLE